MKIAWKIGGIILVLTTTGCMDETGAPDLGPDLTDIVADKVNIVEDGTYKAIVNSDQDSFDIDSVAIDGAILSVFVAYGGGCTNHDFVLFGTDVLALSYPPQMFTTLTHDAHGDTCERYVQDTLTFDLSPIAELMGEEFDTIIIHVNKAPQDAVYDGSVVTNTP